MVAIRNFANPETFWNGGYEQVSARVAIRIAIRVAISIRNPRMVVKTRFQSGLQSGLRIATLNHNLKPLGFDLLANSQPRTFSMVATMVSVSIKTSLNYSLEPRFSRQSMSTY